jgi:hypothetical protein
MAKRFRMESGLVYVIPGEALDVGHSWSLEKLIERMDCRGDETFKLQTKDNFTVYERLYRHNTDGTKDIISKTYLSDDELHPKKPQNPYLNGERLVDGTLNVHY